MRKYFMLLAILFRSLFCFSQVPVSIEPMHHNVFENAFVRVLDVHVPPGDTTQFHKHETPSVFIVLQPVKTGSEVITEEINATALAKDATVSFEGFYTKPRIHRVWNADTTEFHVMDVEILTKQAHSIDAPIQQQGFKLLYDEIPVRVYRLTLQRGMSINLQRSTPVLLVGLNEATTDMQVNKKAFRKKGDYIFIEADNKIQLNNKSEPGYSFAVLEFK